MKLTRNKRHNKKGGFFTRKKKNNSVTEKNNSVTEKYLKKARTVYRKIKNDVKDKKGVSDLTPEELVNSIGNNFKLLEKYKLIEAEKTSLKIQRENLIQFLKASLENNFVPTYTSWYRSIENDQINKETYKIKDIRCWNIKDFISKSPGFLYIWQQMTGNIEDIIDYKLEDLNIIAMYEILNNTEKHKIKQKLHEIMNYYLPKPSYINKLYINNKIDKIIKNLNNMDASKYMSKFYKTNITTISRLLKLANERIKSNIPERDKMYISQDITLMENLKNEFIEEFKKFEKLYIENIYKKQYTDNVGLSKLITPNRILSQSRSQTRSRSRSREPSRLSQRSQTRSQTRSRSREQSREQAR